MAEWKKVVVSGSSANLANLQVDSLSSGVVTGAAGNLTTTAINGTGNIVATSGATGLIHSGSFSGSFQGDGSNLTGITATSLDIDLFGSDLTGITVVGTDKLILSDNGTEGRISVSQLATPLAGTGLEANAGTIRIATSAAGDGLQGGGGSALAVDSTVLRTTGFGIISSSAQIASDISGSFTSVSASIAADIASITTSFTLSADSGTNDTFNSGETLTFTGANGISTVVTNNQIQITAGGALFSGSAQITLGGDLSGTADTASVVKVQGVAITSGEASQIANIDTTTINATQWGYVGALDQGLATSNSPSFANLTVTGDLTVQGDTTELQVSNLNVEDQFILLNSGSITGDSGIIFGGANGAANTGVGLIWDYSYNSNDGRLAIVNTLAAGATGVQTPSYSIAGVFEGTAANAATAQADHVGNIRVESGEIYIYV